jgi:hypothetical protein
MMRLLHAAAGVLCPAANALQDRPRQVDRRVVAAMR